MTLGSNYISWFLFLLLHLITSTESLLCTSCTLSHLSEVGSGMPVLVSWEGVSTLVRSHGECCDCKTLFSSFTKRPLTTEAEHLIPPGHSEHPVSLATAIGSWQRTWTKQSQSGLFPGLVYRCWVYKAGGTCGHIPYIEGPCFATVRVKPIYKESQTA
jgi:hypothetical protein